MRLVFKNTHHLKRGSTDNKIVGFVGEKKQLVDDYIWLVQLIFIP
jgi:hypothetical protein